MSGSLACQDIVEELAGFNFLVKEALPAPKDYRVELRTDALKGKELFDSLGLIVGPNNSSSLTSILLACITGKGGVM